MASKKIKEEEKKHKKFILFWILLLLLLIFVFMTIITIYSTITTNSAEGELDILVTVGDHTGINVNTTALYFGTLLRSTSATREVLVTNPENETLHVGIEIKGDLKDWIKLSIDSFYIEPDANQTVDVTLNIPSDAEFGDYTGKLKLAFAL